MVQVSRKVLALVVALTLMAVAVGPASANGKPSNGGATTTSCCTM